MNSKLLALCAITVSAFATSACIAPDTDGVEAPEVAAASEVETASDELATAANRGYYIARRDTRRCMSPYCGGYFVRMVNQTTLTCADGRRAAECYVADINLAALGLDAAEKAEFTRLFGRTDALVRATMASKRIAGRNFGVLSVNEAWRGATGAAPQGTFYRAADNGIRCFRAPCPTTSLTPLNNGTTHNALSVVLDQTVPVASQEDIDAAQALSLSAKGILFAGGIQTPRCQADAVDCGPKGVASEFYLPFVHAVDTTGRTCGARAGDTCSRDQYCNFSPSAICGQADATGICAARPQVCPMVYMPVCGCNGQTYSNSCAAAAAGQGVLRTGECQSN